MEKGLGLALEPGPDYTMSALPQVAVSTTAPATGVGVSVPTRTSHLLSRCAGEHIGLASKALPGIPLPLSTSPHPIL